MSELAEGARLEIVYTPKAYPGFKSPSLRHLSQFHITLWRGGRAVECGGLENRFTGQPGNQGSNPCPSAISTSAPAMGLFHCQQPLRSAAQVPKHAKPFGPYFLQTTWGYMPKSDTHFETYPQHIRKASPNPYLDPISCRPVGFAARYGP